VITGLTLIFVAFKLVGVIDWSWLWVLSPLWIGIPMQFLILIATALVGDFLGRRSK
jgi:ribose/xylose/arabinose/galactoside ABC-type transport system permease subunit